MPSRTGTKVVKLLEDILLVVIERWLVKVLQTHYQRSDLKHAAAEKGACTTLDSVLGIAATESRYDLLPHGRIGLDPLP